MGPSADMWFLAYLRDTLLVLAAVEDSPGNAAGVLALEEKRLGLAVLETEDLAVATDVQLTLTVSKKTCQHFYHGGCISLLLLFWLVLHDPPQSEYRRRRGDEIRQYLSLALAKSFPPQIQDQDQFPTGSDPGSIFEPQIIFGRAKKPYLSRVDPLAGEGIVVRSHCGGIAVEIVGCREMLPRRCNVPASIFLNFFPQRGCAIGLPCDRLAARTM